jgi:hypothetical protein
MKISRPCGFLGSSPRFQSRINSNPGLRRYKPLKKERILGGDFTKAKRFKNIDQNTKQFLNAYGYINIKKIKEK